MNPIKVSFKPAAFPKMLADLTYTNQFLKVFAVLALVLSIIQVLALVLFVRRPPVVIALSPSASQLEMKELPRPEEEIKQAVRVYIEKRYNWTQIDVDQKLDQAKAFVAPQSVQNFVQGVSNVRRFSKEKGVSQRAYPFSITVDLKRAMVSISGDRITEIQGMRAAGALTLDLSFQSGPRSQENPWGIYIVKEIEK